MTTFNKPIVKRHAPTLNEKLSSEEGKEEKAAPAEAKKPAKKRVRKTKAEKEAEAGAKGADDKPAPKKRGRKTKAEKEAAPPEKITSIMGAVPPAEGTEGEAEA